MNSSDVNVRECSARDIPFVTTIYAHHVLHGLATFEIEPPAPEEMERRRRSLVDGGFPYLVAETAGELIGYSYAGPYRPRPAYRYTVEDSVYVRPDSIRQGIGRLLVSALILECRKRGFRQVVAVIGDSANRASIRLHEELGFNLVGTLRKVGFKFGRWVDTVLMQRELVSNGCKPLAEPAVPEGRDGNLVRR